MRRAIVFPVLLLALLASTGDTLAQGGSAGRGNSFGVGLGVVAAPRPYTDVETAVIPVPVLLYQRGGFYFRGVQAGYQWFADAPVTLDVFGVPRFDGYDEDDSDALEGMDERDYTLDAGVGVAWRRPHLEIALNGTSDVSRRSEGERVELQVRFPFQVTRWRIVPAVAAQWQSEETVDYYFGVERDEARPGRPAYAPKSTVNHEISVLALWQSARPWALFGRAYRVSYGDEIKDSPIVETSSDFGALLCVLYMFRR